MLMCFYSPDKGVGGVVSRPNRTFGSCGKQIKEMKGHIAAVDEEELVKPLPLICAFY